MTVGAYLRIFRERWRLIASITVLSVLIAVGITALTPKQYQSSAQVFVASNTTSDPLAQYQAAAFVQQQVATFASIVTSPDILHRVESDLNLAISDQTLKAKISAVAPTAKSIVDINATDSNPDRAAAIANSTAHAFIEVIQNYLTTTGTTGSSVRLYITDPATAASSPTSPNAVLNVALGLLLGLLLGMSLAVIRDVMDTRIKDADALAKTLDAPVMGVVIEDSAAGRVPVASRGGTGSERAENYRQLRANLQFANVDEHPRIIAITSAVQGEGKTTVAINLASTLAEAGFTVCLVDADLRRSNVAKVLGLTNGVGLTSVLVNRTMLSDALQNAGMNLQVLAAGPPPPNPSEVLASTYVRSVIRSLLERVDYVIVDTAPLLPVADGAEVAALADGSLLVARHGVTTDAQVKDAKANLRRVDAPLLGVVLNRVPVRAVRGQRGFGYYGSEQPRRGFKRSTLIPAEAANPAGSVSVASVDQPSDAEESAQSSLPQT